MSSSFGTNNIEESPSCILPSSEVWGDGGHHPPVSFADANLYVSDLRHHLPGLKSQLGVNSSGICGYFFANRSFALVVSLRNHGNL